jgi:integrase/recombinase XerD
LASRPLRLGLEEVRTFQVRLVSAGISWSGLNQVLYALRFFNAVTLGAAVDFYRAFAKGRC